MCCALWLTARASPACPPVPEEPLALNFDLGSDRPMTEGELAEALKLDPEGRAHRDDRLAGFPEVGPFVGLGSGRVISGMAVELLHRRDRPRSSPWTFRGQLGADYLGLGIGYILIPILNFNIGPFVGRDLEKDRTLWGLQLSIFSF